MAISSDEIVKREVIEQVGYSIGDLRIRVFPEGSNDDTLPYQDGGLTFGYEGVYYGSCDVAWYRPGEKYKDGYDGNVYDNKPVLALEVTDALRRGSTGNAQYQRFHHALGAVKNGGIGVYYLRADSKNIVQPDLYWMAYNASQIEKGTYIVTQDLSEVKEILSLIHQFGEESIEVKAYLDEILEKMKKIFLASFEKRYKNNWNSFADKRSTIFLDEETVLKYAARNKNNFILSSQRAGHIALGEMFLTKYFFPDKNIYYLFTRMTADDYDYLNNTKASDKEWGLLTNEPRVEIKTVDHLEGLPKNIRNGLIDLADKPLNKNPYLSDHKKYVSEIKSLIQTNKINIL